MIRERYGDIKGDFSIVALGKLGACELNYSSDIDIISLYDADDTYSSGILTPSRVHINRIHSHEYFCKLTELLVSLLSTRTDDGIVYRVDLRLRPNGEKGDITLPLSACLSYYESWGKTWERMALIRARPIAGSESLGKKFMYAIEPFVWKKTIDYSDIEEIKNLKKKIDSISDINDIKRGFGGIREIEFFVHTLQLLHGGDNKKMRSQRLRDAIKYIAQESIISMEDHDTLLNSYLFLRRVENILQMKDDLQTHSLPSDQKELDILSRKMGYTDSREFLSFLKVKRLKVKDMYNSLLGDKETQYGEMWIFDEELTDSAIREYLRYRNFTDIEKSLKNLKILIEHITYKRTLRERNLLRNVIPYFIDRISGSVNKDSGLTSFVSFIEKIGNYESYIDLLSKRKDTMSALANTFCFSSYLTEMLLRLENLEGIFEYPDIRVDYASLRKNIIHMLLNSQDPMNLLRENKNTEELKCGLLFISKIIDVYKLTNMLTMLANTILKALLESKNINKDFCIIGLGRLGAKSLTFGSDLDLLFISSLEEPWKVAEEVIRIMTEYKERGILYKVDMRLRPDGTKGILVNDMEGYRTYYLKHAHPWELQALIKARPVAGDRYLMKEFYNLKKEVIIKRSNDINVNDVNEMRKKIMDNISKDHIGYDIKHGRGGIGEIEFAIQYLQIKNSIQYPDLITFNSEVAIKRLSRYGIITHNVMEKLLENLRFLKTVDTLLRLNKEDTLRKGSPVVDTIREFLEFSSRESLIKKIEDIRSNISDIVHNIYF